MLSRTVPNAPLEPPAGGNWVFDSKLSSARRGSAAGRWAARRSSAPGGIQ